MNYKNIKTQGTALFSILPTFLLFPMLLLHHQTTQGMEATKLGTVSLDGTLVGKQKKPDISQNISAVAIKGNLLVAGADEGADVLVFKNTGADQYSEVGDGCIPLEGAECGLEHKGAEVDIEGLAWSEKFLYVIGSHSKARKSVKPDNSLEENRERLNTIKIEPSREQLFRLKLDDEGNLTKKIKKVSLRDLFANHGLLSLFQPIPSKENGIDIEGLAVKQVDGEDQLYIGFRGPVLRGNHAIVMIVDFEDGKFKQKNIKKNPKIHYLNLGGRGIRGITEAGEDGFLILAGPVGDSLLGDDKSRYQVYFWNGEEDDLAGVAREPLCSLEVPEGIKAEGIDLLNKNKTNAEDYRFVVVYDGASKGGPTMYSCKP